MEGVLSAGRQILPLLWRRRLLILIVAGTTTVLALAQALVQPIVYSASTRFVVGAVLSQKAIDAIGGRSRTTATSLGELPAETQAKLVPTSVVAARVAKALGLGVSPETLMRSVKVSVAGDRLLEVTATHASPELAAAVANAFTEQYLSHRKEQALQAIRALSDAVGAAQSEVQTGLAGLDSRTTTLSGEIAALTSSVDQGDQAAGVRRAQAQAELDRLSAERGRLSDELEELRVRGDELQLGATTTDVGHVIARANIPTRPAGMGPLGKGAAGALAGLVLGVAVALLMEQLKGRVQAREEAASATGAPVLGAVPALSRSPRARSSGLLVALANPSSPAAEEYRILWANLAAQGVGTRLHCLLVTSPGPAEGKSATVANIAVASAASGLRTLAISADLRRPRLHGIFQTPRSPGLVDVLRGKIPLSSAIHPTEVPNLWVLPSEAEPHTGSDLLASPRLNQILSEAASHADVIVLDAAAVSDGADASILARVAGASLLAIRSGASGKATVMRAATTLAQAGSPVLGTVVNPEEHAAASGPKMIAASLVGVAVLTGGALAWAAIGAPPEAARTKLSLAPVEAPTQAAPSPVPPETQEPPPPAPVEGVRPEDVNVERILRPSPTSQAVKDAQSGKQAKPTPSSSPALLVPPPAPPAASTPAPPSSPPPPPPSTPPPSSPPPSSPPPSSPPPSPSPTPSPTPSPSPTPDPAECQDGEDNDLDGKTDFPADLGCRSADDDDEDGPAPTPSPTPTPPPAECADGKDNDGDGMTDMADPGCTSASDDSEESDFTPTPPPPAQCADGIDNDGDGKIDFAGADPGCASPDDTDETDPTPSPGTTPTPSGSVGVTPAPTG